MITIKEWMDIVNYRITEGSDFTWNCYGQDAYCLDSWDGEHDGISSSIVFDTKTQEVFETTICDYEKTRAYRLINPNYVQQHRAEAASRGVEFDTAWDNINYIDLETVDDFLDKSYAIINGLAYDERVVVPLDIDDDLFSFIAKEAHKHDITFNKMVEVILKNFINSSHDNGISS